MLPLVRGGVWFVSLFGRGVCGCLATGLPLGCEVVFERGVRYSQLYKSSSVEVPSVGVLGGQDSGLEILLGEGGNVELGARTLKHILVFVFDPLSLNSLSLICVVHSIIHFIHIIYIACVVLALIHIAYSLYAWIVVCASLVLNHKSFI